MNLTMLHRNSLMTYLGLNRQVAEPLLSCVSPSLNGLIKKRWSVFCGESTLPKAATPQGSWIAFPANQDPLTFAPLYAVGMVLAQLYATSKRTEIASKHVSLKSFYQVDTHSPTLWIYFKFTIPSVYSHYTSFRLYLNTTRNYLYERYYLSQIRLILLSLITLL